MPPKRPSGSPSGLADRQQLTLRQMLTRASTEHESPIPLSDPSLAAAGFSSLTAYSRAPVKDRILRQRDPRQLGAHRQRALSIGFQDSDATGIVTESIEFSLICPYAKTRISLPVRSTQCSHIQCVDVDSWVALVSGSKAARDPMSKCPVCSTRVALSTLTVDEWVAEILREMPDSVKTVSFDRSGVCTDATKVTVHSREELVIDATQGPSPVRVKMEPGLAPACEEELKPEPLFDDAEGPGDDQPSPFPDVVFVSDNSGENRATPSGIRRWKPYCPLCESLLTLENGSSDPTSLLISRLSCCGRCATRANWPLLRDFGSGATMELTHDGTLILIGAGIHRLSPYLNRGGYVLSASGNMWTSSSPLTRPEIDFLEAAMEQAVKNPLDPSIVVLPTTPVSLRFRWEKGSGTSAYGATQVTPTLANAGY